MTGKTTLRKPDIRRTLALCGCTMLFCFLEGCVPISRPEIPKESLKAEEADVIADLAYDENPELGYTVYIKESGELKPYYVLTSHYNGSADTLLLRKYIMPELRRYNSWSYDAAYYNGCEIDRWLNHEFLAITEAEPVYSFINISSREALGRSGKETEDIMRKVFLLSWGEVGGEDGGVTPSSGEPLAYFDEYTKRAAYRELGSEKGCAWYLRSAKTWDFEVAIGVSPEGTLGAAEVTVKNGIRPAFCLDSGTEVELTEIKGAGVGFVVKDK